MATRTPAVELREVVGGRLKELRRIKGVTQQEVATVAGCTQAAISIYESGKRLAPLSVVVNLARAYDVSVEALIGWEPLE